jgi:predicted  nucleic acid-binding Zn-ribbon protein
LALVAVAFGQSDSYPGRYTGGTSSSPFEQIKDGGSITPQSEQRPPVESPQDPNESAEHKHARQNLDQATKSHAELLEQIKPISDKLGQNNAQVERLQKEQMNLNPSKRGFDKASHALTLQIDPILADSNELVSQILTLKRSDEPIMTKLPLLKSRLEHADDCVAVYNKTIDEKVSDITTRESEQIKACKSLDLYPPNK